MDWMTKMEILKENGNVAGFEIHPQGTTEDECFCQMFPRKLIEGKASIVVSEGNLILKSIGISGPEEFCFKIEDDIVTKQLDEIFSGLGRNYKGRVKLGGFGGCSLIINFEKIKPLNKREAGKRERSIWRNPTEPKDKTKIPEWERIFT